MRLATTQWHPEGEFSEGKAFDSSPAATDGECVESSLMSVAASREALEGRTTDFSKADVAEMSRYELETRAGAERKGGVGGGPLRVAEMHEKGEQGRLGQATLGQETLGQETLGQETIGKYFVRRLLGRGGQATAWLAWDPDLRREVVIKLYHAAKSEAQRQVVLHEGQALARIDSPHVARCHGAERHFGCPYLVMEYVRGEQLAESIRRRPWDVDSSLRLMHQLAQGVAAVHSQGLLHRDLKPSNILLAADGSPKLIDFGLATAMGDEARRQISGTPAYMAPEQASGDAQSLDPRADVFGLGAVMYELLTGRPPYVGESTTSVWRQAREGQIVPVGERLPGLKREVAEVAMRCLARDASERFASAAELRDALDRLLNGQSRGFNFTLGWGRWRVRLALGITLLAGLMAAWMSPALTNHRSPPTEVASRDGAPASVDPAGDLPAVAMMAPDDHFPFERQGGPEFEWHAKRAVAARYHLSWNTQPRESMRDVRASDDKLPPQGLGGRWIESTYAEKVTVETVGQLAAWEEDLAGHWQRARYAVRNVPESSLEEKGHVYNGIVHYDIDLRPQTIRLHLMWSERVGVDQWRPRRELPDRGVWQWREGEGNDYHVLQIGNLVEQP